MTMNTNPFIEGTDLIQEKEKLIVEKRTKENDEK